MYRNKNDHQSLTTASKIILTPCFVDDDGHSIRQIQAAIVWSHRQAYALAGGEGLAQFWGQAASLGAKDKIVAGLESHIRKGRGAMRGHGKHATGVRLLTGAKFCPVFMYLHGRIIMIIKASALHLGVIQRKAQRFYQMQLYTSVGTQTDDIASIWRYFWFYQDDMKQGDSLVLLGHLVSECEEGCGQKHRQSLWTHRNVSAL